MGFAIQIDVFCYGHVGDGVEFLVYAPHSSVKGLPGLPVQELPDIIAGGGKSEQKEAPQRLLPLGTN